MLNINEVKTLYLGVQGENMAQTITINVAPWLVAHPGGSVSIWHKRNGDEVPSATGATFDSEAGTVSWSPTSTDTYVDGEGDAEIRLTVGSVIKKSRSVKTTVSPAVTLAGSPTGSGWQDYIDAVDGLKSGAETAMETAAQWATGGTTGTPGATNNAKYYSEQAEGSADDAEAWAVGTDDTTHPAYENSAKDHADDAADAQAAAEEAQEAAEDAQDAAEDAQEAAETAQGLAEIAQGAAEDARDAAAAWATGNTTGTPSATNNAKYYSEQASSSAGTASNKATEAATSATKAENWATGGSGGTASATNNAKYYSEAAASAQLAAVAAKGAAETAQGKAEDAQDAAEAWANGGSSGTPSATNNAKYYAEYAESIIEAAIAEATEDAEDAAEDAEAWAKGTRGGTEVGSSDPTYHNNSEYYAGVAQTAAASASAAYGTDLLAPDYDSTETYAVGDHVIYSGDYYICNTAITTAEAWTAAHWTQVTVSGEIASQKADIDLLDNNINKIANVVGFHINPSSKGVTQAISGRQTLISPVKLENGHSYTLTLTLKHASASVCYFYVDDSNDTQITGANISAGSLTKSKTFTAEANDSGAKITCNTLGETLEYTVALVDNSANTNYVTQLRSDVSKLKTYTGYTEITFADNTYISTPSVGATGSTTQESLNGCASGSISCEKGDVFTLSGTPRDNSGTRVYAWLDENLKCVYREDSTSVLNGKEIVAPCDGTLIINFSDGADYSAHTGPKSLLSYGEQISALNGKVNDLVDFAGETDALTFTEGTYINTPSVGSTGNTTQTSNANVSSLYATCNKGDIFTLTGTPRDNSGTRAYAWLNSDMKCVYRHDETTAMVGTEIVAPCNGTLIVNFAKASTHIVYKGVRNLHNHIIKNINDIKKIVNSPIETLPEYIKNDLAYRPLGQLQNPYLCLSCDDGAEALGTYTIPMLLDKNVPCTFGLWATTSQVGETPAFNKSEVLRTQTGIDAVLSAIEIGCEVAQHGPTEWTEWSEEKLTDFFTREKAAFTELGIDVKGAIYPSHCVNNETRAIVGGIFGSVRSGYRGYKSRYDADHSIPGDVFNPYSYDLTGARSNCYSYTSYNTNDKTLSQLKTALDYAISNNYCMIVYWHDWDLTTEQKETLEAFIDYAKTTSVNFCTISDIPTLV